MTVCGSIKLRIAPLLLNNLIKNNMVYHITNKKGTVDLFVCSINSKRALIAAKRVFKKHQYEGSPRIIHV